MSKIETGRWSEQLRRMLGQKGQEVVAAELSPEISPTIELEGPTVEWAFLKGVRLLGSGATLGAGGATFTTRFRLRNPLDSGVIAVIEVVSTSYENVSNFLMAIGTELVDLGVGTVATTVMDSRWGLTQAAQSSLIFSVDNVTAADPTGRAFMRDRQPADDAYFYKQPFPLLPGHSLNWGNLTSSATNQAAHCWLRWRERQLPALEV